MTGKKSKSGCKTTMAKLTAAPKAKGKSAARAALSPKGGARARAAFNRGWR